MKKETMRNHSNIFFRNSQNYSIQSVTTNIKTEIVTNMNLLLKLFENETLKLSNFIRFINRSSLSCLFVYNQEQFVNICRSYNARIARIVFLHTFLIFIYVDINIMYIVKMSSKFFYSELIILKFCTNSKT